jgi:hypothetical protein
LINVLAGLWYPVVLTAFVGVFGLLFLPSSPETSAQASDPHI